MKPEPVAWLYENIAGVRIIHYADNLNEAQLANDIKAAQEYPNAHKVTALYPESALAEARRAALQPLEDELVTLESTIDSFDSVRSALRAIIDFHVQVALDPAVSSDARQLIEQGRRAAMEEAARRCEQDLCNRPDDPPANYFDGGLRHCAAAIRALIDREASDENPE